MLKKQGQILLELGGFFHDVFEKHYLIKELVKRDFKKIYKDSVLGFSWTFLKPVSLALIMWFAFTYGLRVSKTSMGMPFICYLFTGNFAWEYFSKVLNESTNVILEYSFLVKKMDFRLSILPVVKLLSNAIISIIFFFIVAIILIINGIYPTLYWFQILYYFFGMMIFSLGLGWMTSSMTVFTKDIKHIIQILIQFGFWATPIIWSLNMLPENLRKIMQLNPLVYIVEGYRNSLVFGKPFWQDSIFSVVYFWSLSIIFLLLGILVFNKLKPHFADVI